MIPHPDEIAGELASQWEKGGRRLIAPDWPTFADTYMTESPYLVSGRLAWWEPGKHVTWVEEERAPYTTGDVARRWLRHYIGGRRVASFNCFSLLDLPQPLYYRGGTVRGDDFAYIDLNRAYYQIYSGRSYDMATTVTPTRVICMDGILPLDATDTEWFADDSEARNSIVGLARMRSRTVARFGRLEKIEGVSQTTSPGLWGYVALILNAVATEAVDNFGAFYVGTDGYIVPGYRAGPLQDMLRDRWGLHSKVAGRGKTLVQQLGRYRVGAYRSARVGRVPGDPKDNLVRLDRDQRDSLAKGRHR